MKIRVLVVAVGGGGGGSAVVGMYQGGLNGNCRSPLTTSAHLASSATAAFFVSHRRLTLHDVSRDGLTDRRKASNVHCTDAVRGCVISFFFSLPVSWSLLLFLDSEDGNFRSPRLARNTKKKDKRSLGRRFMWNTVAGW